MAKAKGMAKTRKWGGKTYKRDYHSLYKHQAADAAAHVRRTGGSARVVKGRALIVDGQHSSEKPLYVVYTRGK